MTQDAFTRVMWWLLTTSAGAETRVRVVTALRARPRNALQLSQDLGMHYTTIRHHLHVLETNRMVEATGGSYGRVYFPSPSLESHWSEFDRIASRMRPRGGSS